MKRRFVMPNTTNTVRCFLVQQNYSMGDLLHNSQKIIQTISVLQEKEAADLIIFPELALTAYPPNDLLLRKDYVEAIQEKVQEIKSICKTATVVLGHPLIKNKSLYNSASVFYQKKIIAQYQKQCLPNESVFDEKRYFSQGKKKRCLQGETNSIWFVDLRRSLASFPASKSDATPYRLRDTYQCITLSCWEIPKERLAVLKQRQKEVGKIPIIYVNWVGGQR